MSRVKIDVHSVISVTSHETRESEFEK